MKKRYLLGGFAALVGVCLFVAIAWGQIAYGSAGTVYKGTFTVTFGTNKSADTTLVTGGLSTDKYFLQVYGTTPLKGHPQAIAKAGTLIVNTVNDTGVAVNNTGVTFYILRAK